MACLDVSWAWGGPACCLQYKAPKNEPINAFRAHTGLFRHILKSLTGVPLPLIHSDLICLLAQHLLNYFQPCLQRLLRAIRDIIPATSLFFPAEKLFEAFVLFEGLPGECLILSILYGSSQTDLVASSIPMIMLLVPYLRSFAASAATLSLSIVGTLPLFTGCLPRPSFSCW